MSDATPARPAAIEIRIGDAPLTAKLDVIAASIAAVREAHRDTMSIKSWHALHRAQQMIAEAQIHATEPHRPAIPQASNLPTLSL